jgi:AbrB family looped-hinge helix DNA binding protein
MKPFMSTVSVSSKFQVVIPKDVRNKLGIEVGQKLQIIGYRGRIEMVIERDIKDMKGFLKGIDTDLEREKDRL